jgi:hypothetical protein
MKNIPFLIIFDSNKTELLPFEEKLRTLINNNTDYRTNYMSINFKDEMGTILLGIEWLCEVMKPI